jgi:hypothetical protein
MNSINLLDKSPGHRNGFRLMHINYQDFFPFIWKGQAIINKASFSKYCLLAVRQIAIETAPYSYGAVVLSL